MPQTTKLSDKERSRLSTFLRMLDSGQGNEITGAVDNIKKILAAHNISFSSLAENPDNLLEPVNQSALQDLQRKYDECIEANIGFVNQNEALRKENQRLRLRVSLVEKFKFKAANISFSHFRWPAYALAGPLAFLMVHKFDQGHMSRHYGRHSGPPLPLAYLGTTAIAVAFWAAVGYGDSHIYDRQLNAAFESAVCKPGTDAAACENYIEAVRSPLFRRGVGDVSVETSRSPEYTSSYTTPNGTIAAKRCYNDQIAIYSADRSTVVKRMAFEKCTPA